MDIATILTAAAEMADEVPFLVVDLTGRIVCESRGVGALDGGTLEVDGHRLAIHDGAVLGDWLRELQRRTVRGRILRVTGRDGTITSFRFNSMPMPAVQPELIFLRFDPLETHLAGVQGLDLRPPVEIPGAVRFFGLWTRSADMKRLFKTIEQIAEADPTVLIRGESGTGKEHVARALHSLSKRASGPFVAINCAALAPSLLESELFGHKKGAFTGAMRDHIGIFERADRGTIFLDEVAEMPLDLQTKLLRVLQERTVLPVGGTQAKSIDVRVISATHRSLREAVAAGQFREDLMYRLRVVPLFIPPLRDRRGDIELLVSVFLRTHADHGRHEFTRVHPTAMRVLLDHRWPGNVRELQNACEYAAVVGTTDMLTPDDLPPEFRDPRRADTLPAEPSAPPSPAPVPHSPVSLSASISAAKAAAEAEQIRAALIAANGHKGDAAAALGMHRTTLWRKLRMYGLD